MPVDIAGAYAASKSDGVCAGSGLSEQDLVMTKDDHLVVLHDHYLIVLLMLPIVSRIGRAKTVVTRDRFHAG